MTRKQLFLEILGFAIAVLFALGIALGCTYMIAGIIKSFKPEPEPVITEQANTSVALTKQIDIPKPEVKEAKTPEIGGNPTLAYHEAARYLAKTVYGEARGCSVTDQAAVIWCILNRVDMDDKYSPEEVIDVVTAPGQFHGYSRSNPVWDEHYDLALDVLRRWLSEKTGASETGRVLPAEYLYFAAKDGRNRFRDAYEGGRYWDWSLPSPYEEI